MLHLLLKQTCKKERICMIHHFLGFAHGGQLSWVNHHQVGRPRVTTELMVTPSLPEAGLRFSTFCHMKLRKQTFYNLSHVLPPGHSFSPESLSYGLLPQTHRDHSLPSVRASFVPFTTFSRVVQWFLVHPPN